MARTDANHIALERTRTLLNMFRRSKVWNKNPEGALEEIYKVPRGINEISQGSPQGNRIILKETLMESYEIRRK